MNTVDKHHFLQIIELNEGRTIIIEKGENHKSTTTKMSHMISIICQCWLAIPFLLLILLGLFGSPTTNADAAAVQSTSPNQRRRFNEPRLMGDDEKDRKGAGKFIRFYPQISNSEI